jgi:hypothetical protein
MDATTILGVFGSLLIGIAVGVSIWKHGRD